MNDRYKTIFKQNWFLAVVYVLLLIMLYVLYFVPFHWNIVNEHYDEGKLYYKSITLLRLWVVIGIFLAALICFVLLWLTKRYSSLGQKHVSLRAFNVILAFFFLVFPFGRSIQNPMFWMTLSSIKGPDGIRYCVIADKTMIMIGMGGSFVLCKTDKRTLLLEELEPLEAQYKDARYPRWMVRPIGFKQGPYYKLYTTKSGYIVNMVKNKCDLAYNVNTGKAYGFQTMGELSPFVLIGPDDQLNQDDVQKVIAEMKDANKIVSKGFKPSSSFISKPILEEALKNPNQKVSKLARQLLDIWVEPERDRGSL